MIILSIVLSMYLVFYYNKLRSEKEKSIDLEYQLFAERKRLLDVLSKYIDHKYISDLLSEIENN